MNSAFVTVDPQTPAPKISWTERFSDRCNPLVVREVQQFAKSTMFLITSGILLVVILLTALFLFSSTNHITAEEAVGRDSFFITVAVLGCCGFVIVPFYMFNSMRREVNSQNIHMLLLSNMTPSRIVTGKLLSVGIFFLLYFSLLAPLLTLSFFFGSVDILVILLVLFGTILMSFALSCFALCAGTVCRWRAVEIVATIAVAAGLVCLSLFFLTMENDFVSSILPRIIRNNELFTSVCIFVFLMVSFSVFFLLCSASMLAHPYQNRSTPFRVFLVVAFVCAWLLCGILKLSEKEIFLLLYFFAVMGSIPILLGLVTEEEHLSPAVAAQVSRKPVLALLQAPWLPGGGRGSIYMLLLLPFLYIVCFGSEYIFKNYFKMRECFQFGVLTLYAMFYISLAGLVRRFMKPGIPSTWMARLWGIIFVVVGVLISAIGRWFGMARIAFTDLFNPFVVIDSAHLWGRNAKIVLVCVLMSIVFLLNLPTMIRGLHEVLRLAKTKQG